MPLDTVSVDSMDVRHPARTGGTARPHLHPAAVLLLVAALAACATGSPRSAAHTAAGGRATPAGALRWSAAFRDTIPIWIDTAAAIAGWRPELVDVVAAAAAEWSGADMPVHFQRVHEEAGASVRVHWRRWQPGKCRGETRWWVNARGEIVGADVAIVLAPSFTAQLSPAAVLRAIALHELGHALGLPHDADEEAIMYHSTGPLALTARDRDALRSAYGAPRLPRSVAAGSAPVAAVLGAASGHR
jgi:predicted Zn-dependent protease